MEIPVWILLPLGGAAIGYLTNALAIRMLFRPFREVRILGVRLPFTPGIIPRQKPSLARNIAAMVSQQLFTPQVIKTRLQDEAWRNSLALQLDAEIQTALWETPIEKLFGQPKDWLHWVRTFLNNLPMTEVQEFLKEQFERFESWKENTPFEFPNYLIDKIWPQLPKAFQNVTEVPEVKEKLVNLARGTLVSVVQNLNGFQKFIVTVAQYDKTIDENMPRILQDLISQTKTLLESDLSRDEFKRWLRREITKPAQPEKWAQDLTGVIQHWIQDFNSPEWEAYFSQLGQKKLGELFLNSKEQNGLGRRTLPVAQWVVSHTMDLLIARAEPMLETLDLNSMVEAKVLSLRDRDLENLLLTVLKKHLKYINIFGGILGGLIGVFQVLIQK